MYKWPKKRGGKNPLEGKNRIDYCFESASVLFIPLACLRMCVLSYFYFACLHVCAYVFKSGVHCGIASEPGASGLPYYCTSSVCVPDVIGALFFLSRGWGRLETRPPVALGSSPEPSGYESMCTSILLMYVYTVCLRLYTNYTHTHVHTHAHTHTQSHIRTHTHTHTQTRARTHAHTHTHTHTRTHAHTHTYTHTHIHTHTHTHTNTISLSRSHTHAHVHKSIW